MRRLYRPHGALTGSTWSLRRSSTLSTNGPGAARLHRRSEQDLWTITADGSDRRRLTDGNGTNLSPVWSTDNRVFFVSDRDGTNASGRCGGDGEYRHRGCSATGKAERSSWIGRDAEHCALKIVRDDLMSWMRSIRVCAAAALMLARSLLRARSPTARDAAGAACARVRSGRLPRL